LASHFIDAERCSFFFSFSTFCKENHEAGRDDCGAVMAKLLTARGNGHRGIQQLITRMQTLAAGVGGSNLAWCKPAECELWSAEQPTWRQESQLAQRTLSALQAAPSSVNRCMYRQTFD